MSSEPITNLNQFIPGKIYTTKSFRNCFLDYRLDNVFESGNMLTLNITKEEYKFIFLCIQEEKFEYGIKNFYSVLKILYNGKIGYIFVNYQHPIKHIDGIK